VYLSARPASPLGSGFGLGRAEQKSVPQLHRSQDFWCGYSIAPGRLTGLADDRKRRRLPGGSIRWKPIGVAPPSTRAELNCGKTSKPMRRSLVLSWILILTSPAFGTSPQAQRALDQGLALDSQGHYAEACLAYSQAIQLDASLFEAWRKRGWRGTERATTKEPSKISTRQSCSNRGTRWRERTRRRARQGGQRRRSTPGFPEGNRSRSHYSGPWANRALLRLIATNSAARSTMPIERFN